MRDCPQARVDVRVVDLGSELMICDDRRKLVHILNSTARRIWDLCDGTHSVREISEEVNRLYPAVEVGQIQRDVEQALGSLDEKEMIVWVTEEVEAEE